MIEFFCYFFPIYVGFSTTVALDRHREWHQTEKRENVCEVCGLEFKHAANLKVHKKLHNNSGNPIYKCQHCEWSFGHPTNLKQHEMIHSGDRRFKCSHCFASFDQETHLTQHEVIHAR